MAESHGTWGSGGWARRGTSIAGTPGYADVPRMDPGETSPFVRRVGGSVVGAADGLLGVAGGVLRWNHARLAGRAGIDGLVVLLSFDCDTEQDIGVVPEVHARLAGLDVVPTYAVPGELLERGADVYRAVAAGGAEFLNHGYHPHCVLDDATRTYVSSHFYDEIGLPAVEDDVRRGHEAVQAVLGQAPLGFRTPHFGTFQRPGQLRFLHRLLQSLGYRYSSSTTPLHGLVRGPVVRTRHGLVELPVTGRIDAPRRVLDTWSFRFAPGRRVEADDYLAQVRALAREALDRRRPTVLNLYADPSQVADWPGFFQVAGELAPHSLPSFRSLVEVSG